MEFSEALHLAKRNLTDGATLDALRELARDLRTLTPDRILADVIEIIEGRWDTK